MKETKTLNLNLNPTPFLGVAPGNRTEIRPFIWVALLYGCVGSMVVLGFTPDPYAAISWFAVLYAVIVLNLVFLSKLVAVTMTLMSHQGTEKGPYTRFHLYLYGALKLITLGAIVVCVLRGGSAPMLAMVLGLGTMMIIPLFGGVWVSQRN